MLLDKIKKGDLKLLKKLENKRPIFIGKIAKMFPRLHYDQLSDAYSEAILILYANVQNGKLTEIQTSLEAYLFAIGKNVLRNENRKVQKFCKLEYDIAQEDETNLTEQQQQQEQILRVCLQKLGLRGQQMMQLLLQEGKSIAEITKIMDFSNTRSASTAKHKMLTKLKKMYQLEQSRLIG